MAKKRKYTKRNTEYWNSLSRKRPVVQDDREDLIDQVREYSNDNWEPTSIDWDSSTASVYGAPNSRSGSTITKNASGKKSTIGQIFPYLSNLSRPYVSDGSSISISEAIDLCERTYCNISVFKNIIDIMTEFSAADLYLEGGNKSSKKFVTAWMERIKISKFVEEFFREYYRSGNVFIYSLSGKYGRDLMKSTAAEGRAKSGYIPLRYVILDPKEIILKPSSSYSHPRYAKLLSKYELDMLGKKDNVDDQNILMGLPKEVRDQISKRSYNQDGIDVPLDENRLSYIFFKKQGYEPFAVPLGYPVLRDIERKESLKELDQKISHTIDNIILLITMGDEKNGVDSNQIGIMQQLFSNSSVGRTLVSDYTTEAKFILPDIGDILNPSKYEVLNKDIQEGLLNVFVGSEKFSNQAIKSQVFLERLKEGRKAFVDQFLQPEIKKICKEMGFRSYPKVKFTDIDLKDEVALQRVWLRMIELGILTPEQGFKAMKTGITPEYEDSREAQERYINDRREGHYNPIVGGMPLISSREFEEKVKLGVFDKEEPADDSGDNELVIDSNPNPNSPENGRPLSAASEAYGVNKVKDTVKKASSLLNVCERAIRDKYKVSELNDSQTRAAFKLVENIISHFDPKQWNKKIKEMVKDPSLIAELTPNEITEEVFSIASRHKIDIYQAGLLYHSKWHEDGQSQ